MTSEPRIEVVATSSFKRFLKRLQKKYPNVNNDLSTFIDQLMRGETPGDQLQGAGYTVYKARIANRDAGRGKSGGYRVIYYFRVKSRIFLIHIYAKTEAEDVSLEFIRQIIDELQSE